MSRYRKIDVRIWNDAKFRGLSNDGQMVFLLLLTHPAMTPLGAMPATPAGLAHTLKWYEERFREGLSEPLSAGMVLMDEEAGLICLPNFLRYNQPENPNVVKAWASSVDLLPECELKDTVMAMAYRSLKDRPKSFTEAFVKLFGNPSLNGYGNGLPNRMANQEQEQEQEQEPEQEQDKLGSGVEGLAQGREGYDFPYTPPEDADACRFWLEGEGVHPSQMGEALKLAMANRLYADRLEALKQPKEANSYAAAKGRAA